METLPLFALEGQLKIAGDEASGTTPLASPPANDSLIPPSKSKSAMDGGFALAENSLDRTPGMQSRMVLLLSD
jgi:hypothetical protein